MSNEPSPPAKVTVSTSPRGAGPPPAPAPLSNGDKLRDASSLTSTSLSSTQQSQRQHKQQNGNGNTNSTTSTTRQSPTMPTTRRTTSSDQNQQHSHSSTRTDGRSDSEAETVVLPGKENGPSPSKRRKITHEGITPNGHSQAVQHISKPSSSPLSVTSPNPKHLENVVSSAVSPPPPLAPSSALDEPSSSSPTPTRSTSHSSSLSSPSLDNSSKIRRAESDSSLSKTSVSVSDGHDNTVRKRRPAAEVVVQSRDKKASSKRISSPRPSPIEDLARPHRRKPSAAHSDTHLPTARQLSGPTRARSIDADMGPKSASIVAAGPSCGYNHEHCLDPSNHTKYLIDSEDKFSLKFKKQGGTTGFYTFCEKGDIFEAQRFWTQHPEFLDIKDNSNNTPLQAACLSGHAEVVQFLLDVGAAVDNKNDDGDSPLHDASENMHVEVVELLLAHGASPYSKNRRGNLPIDVVDEESEEGEQIAKMLETAREKFKTAEYPTDDEEDEPSTAKSASHRGDVDVRSRTHDRSVQTSDKLLYKSGGKDLTEACSLGELQNVNYFLSSGARVSPKGIFGAAKGGHFECLRVLLGDEHAQPDVVIDDMNPGQDTALLVAIGRGNLSTVKLLVQDFRVDPTKTFDGKTYAQIAKERHGPYWKAEMEALTKAADEWRQERGNAPGSSKATTSSSQGPSKSSKHSAAGHSAGSSKKPDARTSKLDHADHAKPSSKPAHKHRDHGSEDEGTAHKSTHKKDVEKEKQKDAQKSTSQPETTTTKPGRKLVSAREHREGKSKSKLDSRPVDDDMEVSSPLGGASSALDKGSKRQRSFTPPDQQASATVPAPTAIEKPTPKKIKVAKMSHGAATQQSTLTESPAALEKDDPMKVTSASPLPIHSKPEKKPSSSELSPAQLFTIPQTEPPKVVSPDAAVQAESSLAAAQRAREQEMKQKAREAELAEHKARAQAAAAQKAQEQEAAAKKVRDQQEAAAQRAKDQQAAQRAREQLAQKLPDAIRQLYTSTDQLRTYKSTSMGMLPLRFAYGHSINPDAGVANNSKWVTNFTAAIVLGIPDLEFKAFPQWERIPLAQDLYSNVYRSLSWPYLLTSNGLMPSYNQNDDENKSKFAAHKWYWVRVEDVLAAMDNIPHLAKMKKDDPQGIFLDNVGGSFNPKRKPFADFVAEYTKPAHAAPPGPAPRTGQ